MPPTCPKVCPVPILSRLFTSAGHNLLTRQTLGATCIPGINNPTRLKRALSPYIPVLGLVHSLSQEEKVYLEGCRRVKPGEIGGI